MLEAGASQQAEVVMRCRICVHMHINTPMHMAGRGHTSLANNTSRFNTSLFFHEPPIVLYQEMFLARVANPSETRRRDHGHGQITWRITTRVIISLPRNDSTEKEHQMISRNTSFILLLMRTLICPAAPAAHQAAHLCTSWTESRSRPLARLLLSFEGKIFES